MQAYILFSSALTVNVTPKKCFSSSLLMLAQ
jgi:hypothetical protein